MKGSRIYTVDRRNNDTLLASKPIITSITRKQTTMKLSQLCCTAALAAAPAMAILAKFCPSKSLVYPVSSGSLILDASAPKWSEGHDIADKSCFRLGPDKQTTMRIESTPNMAGAAKYCMYLSAGSDCLCNTVTYEFDLTSG